MAFPAAITVSAIYIRHAPHRRVHLKRINGWLPAGQDKYHGATPRDRPSSLRKHVDPVNNRHWVSVNQNRRVARWAVVAHTHRHDS